MSELKLNQTRIRAGVWEGALVGAADHSGQPEIEIRHLDKPLPGLEMTEDPQVKNLWKLQVQIPVELLSDGIQTFVVQDASTGDKLDTFSIVTGRPLDDDLRAEIDLLRAELDLLKQAFRRHCHETSD